MNESLSWLALVCVIVATAAAQTLFKLYFIRERKILLVAAVAVFGIIPFLTLLALIQLPLGLVYVSTSLVHIAILISAFTILGEKPKRQHLAAISLIIAGIVFFNF